MKASENRSASSPQCNQSPFGMAHDQRHRREGQRERQMADVRVEDFAADSADGQQQ